MLTILKYIMDIRMQIKTTILVLVLIGINILSSCSSCAMDRYYSYYIKNCTNDTLLIDVSGVDSLRDWIYWNEQVQSIDLHIDTKENMDFVKATMGKIVLPDSMVSVYPGLFSLYDTCYIYAIKLKVAKSYLMDEIRKKKLYDKRCVVENKFSKSLFEYK